MSIVDIFALMGLSRWSVITNFMERLELEIVKFGRTEIWLRLGAGW